MRTGFDDLGVIDLGQSGDVLLDGGVEQLHILRQIADMPASVVFRPIGEIGAVEPDFPHAGLDRADQQPRQGAFPGARGPDDPQTGAGGQIESDVLQNRSLDAWGKIADALGADPTFRCRQRGLWPFMAGHRQ